MRVVCCALAVALILVDPVPAQTRLLAPTADPQTQGWLVTTNISPPFDVLPGPTEMRINTIGGGGSPSTLLLFHRDSTATPGTDFWVEISMKVVAVQAPHNTYDAGVALFAAYSTGFGSPTERGQMVFFDENLIGWGDESQTYAMSTIDTFHTYRLEVYASGTAVLLVDGVARLTKLGFSSNARVAFGDQTNDASLDGTFLIEYLDVDNQSAACAIATPLPGAMVSGDVSLDFSGVSASGRPVTSTFEHSTDSGATWSSSTAAPGSPLANPDPSRPTPFTGVVFVWDSAADGVGVSAPSSAIARIRVDDGSSASSCSVMLMVDNVGATPTCTTCGECTGTGAAIDILDALTAAQLAAGILVPSPTQLLCCDVDSSGAIAILDALRIAQAAAGLPVTLVCP